MYRPMLPCPECERHVRLDEASCPFCDCEQPSRGRQPAPDSARRMSRAAAFVFASVAVACGGTTVVDDTSGSSSGTTGTTGSGTTGSGTTGSGNSSSTGAGAAGVGGDAPLYGAPAVGGSSNVGGMGMGGGQAIYGAAPFGGAGGDGEL